jgi:antitoxin ChpS
MVAVPPAYLEQTGLGPRESLAWEIQGDRLVLMPERPRRKYALSDLLAECDPGAPMPEPDPEWTSGSPEGNELV